MNHFGIGALDNARDGPWDFRAGQRAGISMSTVTWDVGRESFSRKVGFSAIGRSNRQHLAHFCARPIKWKPRPIRGRQHPLLPSWYLLACTLTRS